MNEDEVDANKDLEILNEIKDEVKQTLTTWWETKATIDVNAYPDQISSFTET